VFNNILCPIDFTTYSNHALEHAVAIARSYGGAVTGVYVLDNANAGKTDDQHPSWTLEDAPRLQTQVLKILHEANAPSPTAVAVLGNPAVEIQKLGCGCRTDLIVVPVHGRTGAMAHAFGSVSEEVVCHAAAPVLVIPDAASPATPASRGGFRRIVCGVNFSPASMKALRYAEDIATASQAELVVAHVLPVEEALRHAGDDQTTDTVGNDATAFWQRRLHAAAHADIGSGVTVRDRLMTGDPAAQLLQLADEEHCDLIVIGGHRGNPQGCVMNAVVNRSRVPVLTVRVSQ
jgi:nucleotide-binding universal stress UspA family protein